MGLEPTYLADRAPQLARFKQYLDGFPGLPRNVRVTGLRGVGKTVLLQQYGRLAEEAGWIVVGRECNEHLREEAIFGQALVEDCRRAVEQSSRALAIRQRSQAGARQALDLLGSFTISLAGVTLAVQPRTRPGRIPLLDEQLFTSLRLACESASAANRPCVLFCWDEVHVLRDSANHRQFPLGIFLAALARAQRQGLPGDARRLRTTNLDRQPRPRQEQRAHVSSRGGHGSTPRTPGGRLPISSTQQRHFRQNRQPPGLSAASVSMTLQSSQAHVPRSTRPHCRGTIEHLFAS